MVINKVRNSSRIRSCAVQLGTLLLILFLAGNKALASDDSFIMGYATAVLEREFNMSIPSLKVENGVVTLRDDDIRAADSAVIITELLKIKGVKRVEVIGDQTQEVKEAELPAQTGLSAQEMRLSEPESPGTSSTHADNKKDLFAPLIADPRWPHFSLAYNRYTDGGDLLNVGAVSFGETLPLYQDKASSGGQWQIGLQAAVFAVFDLDTSSWDLQNEDYTAAVYSAYRRDLFSSLFRVYHQSSHIGDELLLHSTIDRENYSYQAVDLKLSYDLRAWLRVYGGGEYAFSRNPKDLKPWATQYGFELLSQRKYVNGIFRPVAGADFKNREENSWHSEISLTMGLQIEGPDALWRKWQIMLGYYNGNSPNGQFRDELIEFLSLGAHFYF